MHSLSDTEVLRRMTEKAYGKTGRGKGKQGQPSPVRGKSQRRKVSSGERKTSAGKKTADSGRKTSAGKKAAVSGRKTSAGKKTAASGRKTSAGKKTADSGRKTSAGRNGSGHKNAGKNNPGRGRNGRRASGKEKTVWKKWLGIAAVLTLTAAAGGAYLKRADYFREHFYKGTWINGLDCSFLTADQAKEKLLGQAEEFTLTVTGRGQTETITGMQMKMRFEDDGSVEQILQEQKPLLWLMENFQGYHSETTTSVSYDGESLRETVLNLSFLQESFMQPPRDAYVEGTDEGYVVIPEDPGSMADVEMAAAAVQTAADAGESQVDLEAAGCYLEPAVYGDDPELARQAEELNRLTCAVLTYQVCGTERKVDRSVLRHWVTGDPASGWAIDQEKVRQYIDELADERDSYGKARTFTTHSQEQITLTVNQYGWLVDRDRSAEELFRAIGEGRQGEMELEYFRTAKGTGADDLGSVYVEISIDRQTMWCYRDGQVLVETPVVTGDVSKGYDTPRGGCWPIRSKTTEYTMHGPRLPDGTYEYTAFVHFWMPFNGGVGIHDLGSRSSFGGDIYLTNGSHGCINTPYQAAKTIYENVTAGTPVIVY